MTITNGYATLQQVKSAARIADAIDDPLLELSVESASRQIDGVCERRFYTAGTETRQFTPTSMWECDIDDVCGTAITVATSSGVARVFDIAWDAADFQVEPMNRTASGITWPVTRLRAVRNEFFPTVAPVDGGVQVTGVFGFGTAIPVQITQATVLLALRTYKRLDSPLGVAGFGDMGAVRVSRIDPDIQSLIAPFRRFPFGLA